MADHGDIHAGVLHAHRPMRLESIVLIYIRLSGVLSANRRWVLQQFEVEGSGFGRFCSTRAVFQRHHPLRANQRDSPFVEL